MKIKHTLIALLLLAALGGAYYFVQKQPTPEEPAAIPREPLFSFQPEDVTEFTLAVSGQPAATFRRLPDAPGAKKDDTVTPGVQKNVEQQWEIVEPAGIPADSYQIQSFIDEFANFKANPLGGEADAAAAPLQEPVWSEYGLDQPVRTLQVKTKDGKSLTLDVGKDNPSGYAKYARRNGAGPVLLLDTIDNKSLLEKGLFELRDKRIFPSDINAATRMDLRFNFGSGRASADEVARARSLGLPVRPERISFIRDANGNWKLTEPARRTDVGGATYLATIVAGGLMNSIVEEKAGNLAKYGLDDPAIRLEVTSPAGKEHLLVGDMMQQGEQQFFYAVSSLRPNVFTIMRTVFDQLNQDLEYYRNRYLFDFEQGGAISLELSGPALAGLAGVPAGAPLRFDRRGENWFRAASMPGGKETPMKEAQVDNFLNAMHSVRISGYTSDEPNRFPAYGLDKPWLSMKVTFGKTSQQETVVYSRSNNKFYAGRIGEPAVYELSSAEPASVETRLKELAAQ